MAESGAIKKLNVEGGVAAKARAVYAALFVPASPPAFDANGSSSPSSPGSPKANGSVDSAANGSGSKLTPGVVAAVPLLKQLAGDPPGQLAQLVAMEWLLAVSVPVGLAVRVWRGRCLCVSITGEGVAAWECQEGFSCSCALVCLCWAGLLVGDEGGLASCSAHSFDSQLQCSGHTVAPVLPA